MPTQRAHQYAEIVRGSNYAPLTLELHDVQRNTAVDLTGATVTITITDESTGEVIVQDGIATQNLQNPYWVEYFLSDVEAAKIVQPSNWEVHWSLTAGNGRVYRVPTLGRVRVKPG